MLKIRGGSIIPVGKVIQNTTETSLDPLTLIVCLDETGNATGTLYEDKGEGFDYLDGEYLLTRLEAKTELDKVIVKVKDTTGQMVRPQRLTIVELITDTGVITGQGYESTGIEIPLITED